MRIRQRFHKRGVAMLLVIISLVTASVLTMSYVAARDNSATIGDNVADAASARWTSDSGLEIALAVLQTEADWRQEHNFGRIIDGYSFGDGMLSIDLIDLETGSAPTSSSEHLKVVATAEVDGVEQESSAIVYAPAMVHRGVDLDLSEFAVFADNRIDLSGDATIMRWPRAALSFLGDSVAIGTRSTAAGNITLSNNAAVIDGRLYTDPNASSSLLSSSNGRGVETISMGDSLPMPLPPQSGVTDPADLTLVEKLLHATLNIVGGLGLINVDTRTSTMTLSGNAVRTLRGPITVTSNDDLVMQNSKLLIEGTVKLIIFDDVSLQNASIELRPGARLMMYIGDTVSLQDSYIGDQRANNIRDNTGLAAPMNVERIRLFRVPSYSNNANWRLSANSVVKGSVYAKSTTFEIRDQSALYGHVAATNISIADQGALFYDPSLNRHNGFTEPDSVLYAADGTLVPSVKTIATLDNSSLKSLADSRNILVKSTIDGSLIEPDGYSDQAPDLGEPSAPSPRTVPVQHRITSFGTNIDEWEQGG